MTELKIIAENCLAIHARRALTGDQHETFYYHRQTCATTIPELLSGKVQITSNRPKP